jgi:16S rRNA U516 pseudouridylate synthase RsuA-like enzyme
MEKQSNFMQEITFMVQKAQTIKIEPGDIDNLVTIDERVFAYHKPTGVLSMQFDTEERNYIDGLIFERMEQFKRENEEAKKEEEFKGVEQ